MICSKCGSKVADGVKYCPICGTEFPEIKVSSEDQGVIFAGSQPESTNNTVNSGYGQQTYNTQNTT